MNRRTGQLLLLAAALATSFFLDGWAFRALVDGRVYERDWGRLLRVTGSLVLWGPLALAVWLERRVHTPGKEREAWLLLIGPVLAGGVAEIIKILVRRERPGPHEGAYVFRAFGDRPFHTGDLGFPSSHAMVAFGGAAVLARIFPRTAPLAYLLATGCALTRVLAHAHFLSDSVAGAIGGWAVGSVLWFFVTRPTLSSEAPRVPS